MADEDWDKGFSRSLAVFLNGDAIPDRDDHGQPVTDDSFLLILHAEGEQVEWILPPQWTGGRKWEVVLSTSPDDGPLVAADRITVPGRSLMLLRRAPLEHSEA
jgi:glycogen operon protein